MPQKPKYYVVLSNLLSSVASSAIASCCLPSQSSVRDRMKPVIIL